MTDHPIRVGFIGLNPDSHWAATAHIPALKALADQFTVVGVANSTPESARRTAAAMHLPHAFNSARELVQSAEVDLVVVTVKVPYHMALVTEALQAGKHVYCEWPLGNGLAEARELARLARDKGVVAVCGTQARTAVEVEYVRSLVAEGYVGKVLSTTLIGSGGNWAGETIAEYAYLFDQKNGASMQSIPLAHTLAAVREVLGDFGPVEARFVSRFNTVQVTDTAEERIKTTPDQIMVHGSLASGAAIAIHYRGGMSRGTNLLWEINGTEGDIQVSGALGHAQMIQLSIRGAKGDESMHDLTLPSSVYSGWPDAAASRNVARIYARLASDIRQGTRTAPSFDDAVSLHELVDAIERSAAR